jgi:hypothetical protein
MLPSDKIEELLDDSLAKKVKENPPEVGDLVHVFCDERRQAYDGFHKSNRISTSLQKVPLGIVTKAERNSLEYADDDDFVAVRRLADGEMGKDSELFQSARCIPIVMMPKLSHDAIPNWPTPTGQPPRGYGG